MYEGTIREKFDVGEKSLLFYHFWILIKICSSFCRKISARWSKLHFTSTVDHSEKEQISRIKQKFWIFLGIRASNLRRLVKNSCTVVKTAFYMYEGTIQEKFDVGDKILLFLSLLVFNQNMFGVFAEKFRHGDQKTAFHVKRWSYQEWTNLSNSSEILNFFGNSSVEFTEFDGEASCTVLKTAFYMYEGTIREKFDVGEKILLFYHFWNSIKNVRSLCRKVSARWSKNSISRQEMIIPRMNKSLE